MALKITPTLLQQSCPTRHSRIPHILSALASKHARTLAPLQSRQHRSATSRALPSNLLARPPPRNQPKQSTPSPPPQPSSRDRTALYVASLFGFSLALYLSFLYVGVRRDWERSKQLALQLGPDADVSDRWDVIGRNYDDEIELAEKVMFMGRKRRRLVSQAKGDVLEVSVGTGRNMKYYDLSLWDKAGKKEREDERVTGLVFNDKAGVMVEAARNKFQELEERKVPAQRFKGRVEFVVGDAGMEGVIGTPNGASGGFDTIVQTMGLCSTKDPVGFLKRLGELCRKPTREGERKGKGRLDGSGVAAEKVGRKAVEGEYGKEVVKKEEDYDGGRILLLEHGRGNYDWLNNVLDGLAPAHADHYGCWWNRDIAAIVEQSGLEVEYIKRYHLGTTWEIVLRPKREEEVVVAAEPGMKEDKSSGIFGWISKATNRVTEAISWR